MEKRASEVSGVVLAAALVSCPAVACGTAVADSATGASARDAAGDGWTAGDGVHRGDRAMTIDAGSSDVVDGDASSSGDAATSAEADADADALKPTSTRVYGVTVDDITNLSGIVGALGALPHKPTTRIVFDEAQQPAYYAEAVPAVHAVSFVMGEILDSAFVKNVTAADYAKRTSAYLAAFPATVDIWEVGNEINGSWLETPSAGVTDVVAKMTGAFDLVRAAGGRTALTLYGCSEDAAHDMFQWTKANVPARMVSGLDYVLVSYYEGDCVSPRVDWPAVFHQLGQLFPTAGIGFGEIGAVDGNGKNVADASIEAPYLQRYYGMQIAEPGYVGGYFWWYFYEDMVPMTRPLFAVLSAALR